MLTVRMQSNFRSYPLKESRIPTLKYKVDPMIGEHLPLKVWSRGEPQLLMYVPKGPQPAGPCAGSPVPDMEGYPPRRYVGTG